MTQGAVEPRGDARHFIGNLVNDNGVPFCNNRIPSEFKI
jgi:hypothetical protein